MFLSECGKLRTDMSLEECTALVKEAYALYGVRPPVVKDGRGRRIACGGLMFIKLPKWARMNYVVLHECAHGLTMHLGGKEAHGPLFVRVYIELVSKLTGIKVSELYLNAKDCGVKIAPASGAQPLKSRDQKERVRLELQRDALMAEIKQAEKNLIAQRAALQGIRNQIASITVRSN